MAEQLPIAKITSGDITAVGLSFRCDRCWVPLDALTADSSCPRCGGPLTAIVDSITVVNPGTRYTSPPTAGGSVSPYRDGAIDKIAEQIWIALNPSHGGWEYATRPDFYREIAKEAIGIALRKH